MRRKVLRLSLLQNTASLIVTNMGRPKKEVLVPEEVAIVEEIVPIQQGIAPLSIDYGREDLNTMARKINELIAYVNEK